MIILKEAITNNLLDFFKAGEIEQWEVLSDLRATAFSMTQRADSKAAAYAEIIYKIAQALEESTGL